MKKLGIGGLFWLAGLVAATAQSIVSAPVSNTTVTVNVPLGPSATVSVGLTGDGSIGQGTDHLNLTPSVGVGLAPSNDSFKFEHKNPDSGATPAAGTSSQTGGQSPATSGPSAGSTATASGGTAVPTAANASSGPRDAAVANGGATGASCVNQPASGAPVMQRLAGSMNVAVVWLCSHRDAGSQAALLQSWPELTQMLSAAAVPASAVVAVRQEAAGRLLVYATP